MIPEAQLARLTRRLEREKRTRLETEAIAERSTRELYVKQQEVLLLQKITTAANEASTVEDAMQAALDELCSYTGWPVGHVYTVAPGSAGEIAPTTIWHLSEADSFAEFRRVTEASPLPRGMGLPGRVLSSGTPVWIMDVNQDSNFPRARQATDIGVKAGFGFPVLIGKRVVAVLEFFAPEAAEPNHKLLSIMGSIGTQLGRVVERVQAQDALRASEEQYRLLFERNLAGVYRTEMDGQLIACNGALARMMGYESPDELLANPVHTYYANPAQRQHFVEMIRRGGTVTNFEVCLRRKDGAEIWVLENATLTKANDAEPVIEGTIIEITERKRAEETIRHMAYHDSLTGLPNRALFQDRLSVALAQARRNGQPVALLSLDLDRFKLFNDTLGHSAGDELLKAAADRLTRIVREGDTVARVGGDEFMLLLPGIVRSEDAAKVAQKIVQSFMNPLRLEGHKVHATASIGISIYPHDGGEADALVRNADAALYRAKDLGRNNYQLYTPAMNIRAAERLTLENGLRTALRRKQFVIYYQPQIKIDNGEVVGVEALLRWRHPEKGLLLPGEFISMAEDTGLIIPIGEWVLRTACAEVKSWFDSGLPTLRLAVNISMRQFQQPDFLRMVESALEDTGLDPQLLELEITESIAMRDPNETLRVLRSLRDLGVQISIDDFGTGYSSLTYLKDLPINSLKIDRSFVRDLLSDRNDATITANIIAIGHGLSLNVIAEGVEAEEQLAFLRREGCDEFQGYLCRKPMHPTVLQKMLAKKRSCAKVPSVSGGTRASARR